MKIYIFYNGTQNIKRLILYSITLFDRKPFLGLNRSVYQHHNITYLKFYFHSRCSFFKDVMCVCICTQTNGNIQVLLAAFMHQTCNQSFSTWSVYRMKENIDYCSLSHCISVTSILPTPHMLYLVARIAFSKNKLYAVLTHCSRSGSLIPGLLLPPSKLNTE